MATFKLYMMIAAGGACGASLRYFLSDMTMSLMGKGFPYATLLVNVIGSFIMGALFASLQHEHTLLLAWRPLLSIGFLGALTTFSTFSLDTLLLFQQGDWLKAGLNILLNVFVCLFVAWLGMQVVAGRAG